MKTDKCPDQAPLPLIMGERQVNDALHADTAIIACLRGEVMTWINFDDVRIGVKVKTNGNLMPVDQ